MLSLLECWLKQSNYKRIITNLQITNLLNIFGLINFAMQIMRDFIWVALTIFSCRGDLVLSIFSIRNKYFSHFTLLRRTTLQNVNNWGCQFAGPCMFWGLQPFANKFCSFSNFHIFPLQWFFYLHQTLVFSKSWPFVKI
jgi:hypothetical protein